jgi:hypothetical protein
MQPFEPAIVVVAFNRPASLKRLLLALENAHYPAAPIPLHISIDRSEVSEVEEIARAFEWPHGVKTVEVASAHRGLRAHILQCGALTKTYGSIVLLEDDLFVAPHFYGYAQQALTFYTGRDEIAGISLYNYQVAESCGHPFAPIKDASDVYFIQVASSWGQAWTAAQWTAFENWYAAHPDGKSCILPSYIAQWGQHSWKKLFIAYQVDQGRYFVFPRTSLSSNFEDPGTNASTHDLFQVELDLCARNWHFTHLADSLSVYDAWFEMEAEKLQSICPELAPYDLEVDVYGVKDLVKLKSTYVLTTRQGENPLASFSNKMRPLLQNVIFKQKGRQIGLFRKEDVHDQAAAIQNFYSEAQREAFLHSAQTLVQCSVVIPIQQADVHALQQTLDTIPFLWGAHTCVLACAPEAWEIIWDWVKKEDLPLQVLACKAKDESALLFAGFKQCTHEVMTWCRPGSQFASDIFDKLPAIFKVFGDVNWIRGIADEIDPETYASLNLAPYRQQGWLALQSAGSTHVPEGEFVFWRSKLFAAERFTDFSFAHLWKDFSSRENLHVVAWKFGSSPALNREYAQILETREQAKQKNVGRLLQNGLSHLDGFRREKLAEHQLPFVLRFDFRHATFFRSPA